MVEEMLQSRPEASPPSRPTTMKYSVLVVRGTARFWKTTVAFSFLPRPETAWLAARVPPATGPRGTPGEAASYSFTKKVPLPFSI